MLNRINVNDNSYMEYAYILFSIVFTIFVLFSPIINGSYVDSSAIRYNIYPLYLLIFNYGFIFYHYSNSKVGFRIIRISTYSLSILLVLYIFSFRNITQGLKSYFNFYPSIVENIDKAAKEHNLKYGVADYWVAKYVTMFSKQDVRLYHIFNDLSIYEHVNNQNWYYGKKGKYANPVFNFIVIRGDINYNYINNIFDDKKEIIKQSDIEIVKVDNFKYDKNTYRPYLIK